MIANRRREFIGSGGVRSSTGLVLVLVMFIGKVAGSQAFLYQYQQALGGVQDMDINGLPQGESRFLQFDTPAPVTSGEVDNTTPVPAPSSDDPDVFVTSAPSDADAASVPGTAQPIAAGDFITQPPTPAPATDSPAVQPSAIASTDRPAAAPTIAPAASVSTSEPSGLVSTGASPSTPPTPSPVTSSTEAPAGPTVTEGSSAPTTGVAPTPSTLAPGTAPPFAPSTCADGITAGVSDGVVCCKQECGVCGDVGCSSIPGTNGASDCCPSTIIAEAGGTFCGEAPCVMEGFTPSPVNPAFVGTAAPVVFSQCSNGLSGYQDRDVCCSLNCGQCGGDGCGSIPGTGGAAFCCSSVIRTAGVTCGEPPCIIEDYTPSPVIVGGGTRAPSSDSLCSNGIAGYQDGAACCEANCGQCGGEGCGSIPGTGGQASCCSSTIEAQNVSCLASGSAPCVIDGYTPAPASPDYGTAAPVQDSWCSNGMPGYQDLDVCCLLQCGQCGGAGCGSIPGTPGSAACCSNTIRESGKICDWSNSSALAPCVIGDWTPSPVNPAFVGTASPVLPSTCSNGIAGYQNGAACCAEICGQCGGVGCGTIPGTGGSPNCCASSVLMSNVSCGAGVEAPCVIPDYTPAPAGVPGTAAPYAPSNCTNGLPGYQDAEICCAENCGQCGGEGCGSLPGTGGSEYCCSTTIRNNGTDCSITGEAPCIIGDWVYTPSPHLAATYAPAAPSNCSNGLAGYQKDDVCCKEVCGLVCGESGCGAVNASNCCATNIRASGVYCEDGAEAPCIIVETDAPTAAPTPVASNPDNLVENTSDAVSMRMLSSGGLLLLMPLVGSIAALLGTSVFGLSLSSVGGSVKP